MRLLEAVRRANAPRPPEHSVRLRLAATIAVLVALSAPPAEGEMSRPFGLACMLLVAAGMTLSHRARFRSGGWVKLAVAFGAVTSLAWFLHQIHSTAVADITGVEDPLTVLLALLLVLHSFHVPARRDLVFAVAASATLMAVAAAQAIDLGFGLYASGWAAAALWYLSEQWASVSGRARRLRGPVVAVAGVGAVAAVAFLLLPAPSVAVRADFRGAAGGAVPVPQAGALAGDSGRSVQLSKPGSSRGPTRVGGYLGFAGSLDTALRGALGSTVVMRVRAQQPTFWLGETFDRWSGRSWSSTSDQQEALDGGAPFLIPLPSGASVTTATGSVAAAVTGSGSDLQTFYIRDVTADLVFHAGTAREVWFPSPKLFFQRDGTIVSPIGVGPGAVYTVESEVATPTASQLERSPALDEVGRDGGQLRQALSPYLQLPHPYPDVAALARSVTAGAGTEYARVEALIGWIGSHTRYSTDIPPLPAGADTVEEFLFGNRTGFCEQISTSLAVMLRSLGIPAREAVGYVPGPYNPVTDLYDVRAEDAHAWVQVWFPAYGWQNFDPTASVPAANPSPGATALSDAGRWLGSLPWTLFGPVAAAAAGIVAGAGLYRRRRHRRPATPAEAAARIIERAGRRAGRPRLPGETLGEYGDALDRLDPAAGGCWSRAAAAVEAEAYGGVALTGEQRLELRASLRTTRRRAIRRRDRLSAEAVQ